METNISKEEILNAFVKVIPYLPYLFEDEISIALTDTDKFLMNQTCQSLNIKSEIGGRLPEGGAAVKAIQTGELVVKEVAKEVYGVPFKSYAVPIMNTSGEVVGAVLAARSLERSHELLSTAKYLSRTYEQITGAVSNLSEDVQNLAIMNREIVTMSTNAVKYANGSKTILDAVQKIASQSNILGINAAIEAARAGEAGRGFQIVAQEIRKMSISTSESIKKISNVLNSIENSILGISDKMNQSSDIFSGHLAVIEEITSSMTELNVTVKGLEELSEKI